MGKEEVWKRGHKKTHFYSMDSSNVSFFTTMCVLSSINSTIDVQPGKGRREEKEEMKTM